MSAPAAPGTDTPSQGIKRRAPVDEPGVPMKKKDVDSDDDDDLGELSSSYGEEDSSDEDDDEEELVAPEETEEERLERDSQAKESGNDAFRAQDYKAALTCYNEAIDADPTNATYFNNRAATHLLLSNYDLAIQDGNSCVGLDDTYFKGWFRLATSYMKRGNLDLCRSTLKEA